MTLFFSCVSSMGGIPARNNKGERLLIYIGIIDILQSYRSVLSDILNVVLLLLILAIPIRVHMCFILGLSRSWNTPGRPWSTMG